MSETLEIKVKPKNQPKDALKDQSFFIAAIRKKYPIYNSIDLSLHSRDKILEMYCYLVLNAHEIS